MELKLTNVARASLEELRLDYEDYLRQRELPMLLKAADEFLFQNQQYRHVQFDILSIVLNPEKEPEYFLIEDVFL